VVLSVGLAASIPTTAAAQDPQAFTVGDLYLLSWLLPSVSCGILRVDPLTGETALLVDIPENPAIKATLTYDPYRDRLVYADYRNPGGLVAVDAAGNRTDLAPDQASPCVVAARGDGIIYLCGLAGGIFRYLDASNIPHDLLDEAGTGVFHFASGNSLEEMIYDPGTNSLVCFTGQSNGVVCATAYRTCAIKVPLTEDGTQVAGPVEFTEVDISASFPVVASGSGLCPTGEVFYVMDTNSNDREPRMQVLDVTTMTSAAYASNGPYVGAAATNAGTYSRLRGQAVILDTLEDSLRAYSRGEVGWGTRVAGGVSGSGSGEVARLVEIRARPSSAVGEREGGQPAGYLHSVWPNPSPTTTTVRYELPASGNVRALIYDAAGRLVRTLAEGPQTAGPHTLRWDSLDDRGFRVTPGLYFVRIEAAGGPLSRTIVVLR
jgi:hypothetical protein